MGLQEKRFNVGDVTYRFKKSKDATHRWRLFKSTTYRCSQGFDTFRWELLKQGMSKAEAERMYKLLRG